VINGYGQHDESSWLWANAVLISRVIPDFLFPQGLKPHGHFNSHAALKRRSSTIAQLILPIAALPRLRN
jgi:hypothetical protein